MLRMTTTSPRTGPCLGTPGGGGAAVPGGRLLAPSGKALHISHHKAFVAEGNIQTLHPPEGMGLANTASQASAT